MPPKKTPVTRGSARQKQRAYIESLAQALSPPKVRKLKKLDKSASFESPEVTKTTPPVVTATKQAKLSDSIKTKTSGNSSSNNSTESKNALVTMATNLTAGADQRLDMQLDNVLQEYLLAKRDNHKVRQMFKAENLYKFEYFVGFEVEDLEAMKRTQNNTTKVFNKRRITMIYNVIRYYKFL